MVARDISLLITGIWRFGQAEDSLLMVAALRPEAQGRRALRTALTF